MRFWSPKNSQLRPLAPRASRSSQEGAERRDAGARPDHDRGRAVVGRRTETVALLHEDRDHIARLGEVGEIARADAGAGALVAVPAHGRHGEMDLARMRLGRRGDRVEARLQAIERLQQAGQRGHHRGKGHQEIEQVGLGQLGRALAAGQRLQLQRLLAVEGAGGEEQHALVAGPRRCRPCSRAPGAAARPRRRRPPSPRRWRRRDRARPARAAGSCGRTRPGCRPPRR